MKLMTQLIDVVLFAQDAAPAATERTTAILNGTAALILLVVGLLGLLALVVAVLIVSRRRRAAFQTNQRDVEKPLPDAWTVAGQRMTLDGSSRDRK